MSEVIHIPPGCIPANPDIAGIGIRVSVYIQNFFTLAIAFSTMTDGKLTVVEARTVAAQSSVLIATACALLLSAFVEAKTLGMSDYHAIIVLNLAWINSSNTVLLLVLFYYSLIERMIIAIGMPSHRNFWSMMIMTTPPSTPSPGTPSTPSPVLSQRTPPIPSPVLSPARSPSPTRTLDSLSIARMSAVLTPIFIGSLHFSVLSAFGLWFWATADTFGARTQCMPRLPIPLRILGHTVMANSHTARKVSLVAYGLLSFPILNFLPLIAGAVIPFIPIIYILLPVFIYYRKRVNVTQLKLTLRALFYIGLTFIAVADSIIIAITETMIHDMKPYVQSGESRWSFGQTLSLFLLVFPLGEFVRAVMELTKVDEEENEGQGQDHSEGHLQEGHKTGEEARNDDSRLEEGLGLEEGPRQEDRPQPKEGVLQEKRNELDSFGGLPRLLLRLFPKPSRRRRPNLHED